MTNKYTDQEIWDLYEEHGTLQKVSNLLADSGVDMSVSTVWRKVMAAKGEILDEEVAKDLEDKEETIEEKPVAAGTTTAPDKLRGELKGKRFVFTTAQNNTYVHTKFLESLENFCHLRGAELIVPTVSYNKKGFQNDSGDVWYDPKIAPYIRNESLVVAPGLVFCGELDVLPTAVNPLSGFENYTQESSGIVPHTKVHMRSLPRMAGAEPRFMYTTGAVTQRNYIQRKAGQKAGFHHVFGALYVEIDENGTWFARQLVANEEGVFHDLNKRYSPKACVHTDVGAITWGDIHVEKLDPLVMQCAWGDDSMLTNLKPTYQFIHDLTDFQARNHHNIKDPFFLAEMHHKGMGNVERDLHRSGAFLQYITRFGNKAVVVDSNHDQALEKWLREAKIHTDPENAEFFHKISAKKHEALRLGKDFHAYPWAVTAQGKIKSKSQFLREDDSFMVHGIEQALHGHRGPNGSRGGINGFRTIGRKINIGHSHSAGIFDGVYVAGVSGKLDMGYNKGPSSWSHSHIVTYTNGKRAIITMKNGKWRA